MEQKTLQISISELASLSKLPVSTIKFYIRENLVPRPAKTGNNKGLYNFRHLDRLKLIQKMKNEGLSLKKISEFVTMINAENENYGNISSSKKNKDNVIQVAIGIFKEKGYEKVTVAEIASASNIGCSTFYTYFKNKKDLFLQCIQKIISYETYEVDENGLHQVEDYTQILPKDDFETILEQTPLWYRMIKTLRAAALNNPDEFKETLRDVIDLKIKMFQNKIKKAIELGYIRSLNQTVLSAMCMGIQEFCFEYFFQRGFGEKEKRMIFDQVLDILWTGVGAKPLEKPDK